jgi:hypothetical protein
VSSVKPIEAEGSPAATSLIAEEVAAPTAVVMSVTSTVSRIGVPMPQTASADGSWDPRSSPGSKPLWRRRPASGQHTRQRKFQSNKVQIERKKRNYRIIQHIEASKSRRTAWREKWSHPVWQPSRILTPGPKRGRS